MSFIINFPSSCILLLLCIVWQQLQPAQSVWTHTFDTVSSMLWADFAGAGYSITLTDEQIDFVANTYSIISLEKCFAMTNYSTTELGVIETARRIKAVNPSVKVIMYYNLIIDFADCYAAGNIFLAHPSWWLKDDNGNPYGGNTVRQYHDTTQTVVQDYYTNSIMTPASWPNASGLLDGVFADGSGGTSLANMSSTRLQQVVDSMHQMLNQTNIAIKTVMGPNAQVIGNGLGLYPNNPPDHGMSSLPFMDGVVWEHFLAFEMLDPKNGSLIPSLFDEMVTLLTNVSSMNKTILVKAWPGPMTTPIEPLGPQYPNGSAPTTYEGRAEAATNGLTPSLAGFLLIVQPNVWLSYSTWYTAPDGYYVCPVGECSTPSNWFPDFNRSLGNPLSNVQRLSPNVGSGWVYTRQFQYATIYFDAVDWTNATITWNNNNMYITPLSAQN